MISFFLNNYFKIINITKEDYTPSVFIYVKLFKFQRSNKFIFDLNFF